MEGKSSPTLVLGGAVDCFVKLYKVDPLLEAHGIHLARKGSPAEFFAPQTNIGRDVRGRGRRRRRKTRENTLLGPLPIPSLYTGPYPNSSDKDLSTLYGYGPINTDYYYTKHNVCNVCFRTFGLNCELRDHTFFAHTAHPVNQRALNHGILTNNVLADGTCRRLMAQNLSAYADVGPLPTDIEPEVGQAICEAPEVSVPGSEAGATPSCVCTVCDKDFEWPSKLRRHFDSVHLRLRPFPCPLCPEKFSSKLGLDGHVSSTHERRRPYACPLCPDHKIKSFAFKASLRNHVCVAHRSQLLTLQRDSPVTLEIIERPVGETGHLGGSSKTEANVKDGGCDVKIDRELCNPSTARYFCESCPKVFNLLSELQRHWKRLHMVDSNHGVAPNGPLYYNVDPPPNQSLGVDIEAKQYGGSGKVLESQRRQKRRRATKFITVGDGIRVNLKVFRCPYCKKMFNQSGHLARHIKIVHQNVGLFKCHLCNPSLDETGDRLFHSKLSLNNHIKRFHNLDQPIPTHRFVCDQCDISYPSRKSLENHVIRAHPAPVNIPCPVKGCAKSFATKLHLTIHRKRFHPLEAEGENRVRNTSLTHYDRYGRGSGSAGGTFLRKPDGSGISSTIRLPLPTGTPPELISMISCQLGRPTSAYVDPPTDPTTGSEDGEGEDYTTTLPALVIGDSLAGYDGHRSLPTFLCESCHETFADRTSLVRHVRHFHEEKSYLCHICGRAYYQKPHLNRHLASTIHADVLPHQCNYCGKRFAQPTQLQKHLVDLFFHQDPTLLSAPKFMCHICTPSQAFLLPPGVKASIFQGPPGHVSPSSPEFDSLRATITGEHGDEALLSSLATTLDEGKIDFDNDRSDGQTLNSPPLLYPLLAFDPTSVRKEDRAPPIRIVRFPNSKDLQVHMKQFHPGQEIVHPSDFRSRHMMQTYLSLASSKPSSVDHSLRSRSNGYVKVEPEHRAQAPADRGGFETASYMLSPSCSESVVVAIDNYATALMGSPNITATLLDEGPISDNGGAPFSLTYDNLVQPYTMNNAPGIPSGSESMGILLFDNGNHSNNSTLGTVQPDPLGFGFLHLCEFCGKTFTYAKTLKEHIKKIHVPKTEFDDVSYLGATGVGGDMGGSEGGTLNYYNTHTIVLTDDVGNTVPSVAALRKRRRI